MNWNERYAAGGMTPEELYIFQRSLEHNRRPVPYLAPKEKRHGLFCDAEDCKRRHPFGRRWQKSLSTGLRLCTHCVKRLCGVEGCTNFAPHGEEWPSSPLTETPVCPDHRATV